LTDLAGIRWTDLTDIERNSIKVNLINIERVAAALALKISELFALAE